MCTVHIYCANVVACEWYQERKSCHRTPNRMKCGGIKFWPRNILLNEYLVYYCAVMILRRRVTGALIRPRMIRSISRLHPVIHPCQAPTPAHTFQH
jgi:hypothetical protein